jgi:hypothetical protein
MLHVTETQKLFFVSKHEQQKCADQKKENAKVPGKRKGPFHIKNEIRPLCRA